MIFLIAVGFTSFFNPPQQSFMELSIQESDFVGFVYWDNTEKQVLIATEVFKGDKKYLSDGSVTLQMDESTEYLLMAKLDEAVVKEVVYLVLPTKDLSDERIAILDRLPCYDKLVAERYEPGFCYKNLDPVCGCDNKEYGNICMMKKNGIVRFRPGRCDKSETR